MRYTYGISSYGKKVVQILRIEVWISQKIHSIERKDSALADRYLPIF